MDYLTLEELLNELSYHNDDYVEIILSLKEESGQCETS